MLEYRPFGEQVFVDVIYKVGREVFEEWRRDSELEKKVIELMEYKKYFMGSESEIKSNSQLKAFFTDSLLLYELPYDTKIYLANLEELKGIIKQGLSINKFGGISTVRNYILLYAKITKWAYEKGLRKDYYNKADFKIIEENYVTKQDVYTPSEMISIFRQIDRQDVCICMLSSIEGLTNKEVLDINRKNLMSREKNIPISVGSRSVNVSDTLYKTMYDYAQTTYIERHTREDVTYMAELNDSEKLIRSIKTEATGDRLPQTALCINIKSHMNKIGYKNLTANVARSYSMYYDLLKGMDINEFNFKYGTKYRHPTIVMKNKDIEQKMKEKIAQEKAGRF